MIRAVEYFWMLIYKSKQKITFTVRHVIEDFQDKYKKLQYIYTWKSRRQLLYGEKKNIEIVSLHINIRLHYGNRIFQILYITSRR